MASAAFLRCDSVNIKKVWVAYYPEDKERTLKHTASKSQDKQELQ